MGLDHSKVVKNFLKIKKSVPFKSGLQETSPKLYQPCSFTFSIEIDLSSLEPILSADKSINLIDTYSYEFLRSKITCERLILVNRFLEV